jgi:hypothetical protein
MLHYRSSSLNISSITDIISFASSYCLAELVAAFCFDYSGVQYAGPPDCQFYLLSFSQTAGVSSPSRAGYPLAWLSSTQLLPNFPRDRIYHSFAFVSVSWMYFLSQHQLVLRLRASCTPNFPPHSMSYLKYSLCILVHY